MIDTVIKNGQVVEPWGVFAQGIAVDDGKIVALGKDDLLPPARQTIDARGNYIIPGLVDPHVHLAYPPQVALAQNIHDETRACAYGGVTTAIHMLRQTGDLIQIADDFVAAYEANACVDLALTASIWDLGQVKQIAALAERGIAGFKLLAHYRLGAATAGLPSMDDGIVYCAYQTIGQLAAKGYRAFARTHCENGEIFLGFKALMQEQGNVPRHWHEVRPSFLEAEAMRRYIYLADQAKCPSYVVHISTREGVDLIARARGERVDVVGETCCQYLVLNVENTDGILGKVQPPIRTKEDNEAIWQGIRDGVISTVGTDHAAARLEHKGDSIWTAHLGFGSISHLLQIMLSEGVNAGRISMEKLVEVCCHNPARIHGLSPRKGLIAVGSDADLVIVDLDKECSAGPRAPYTGSDFNVYDGWKFRGSAVLTMLRGKVIMEDGTVLAEGGLGRYCPAQTR